MATTDLHDVLAYQTHPENLKYQPIEPFTAEKAANYLTQQAALDRSTACGWIAFAVELSEEKRVIGEVGIFLPPEPCHQGDLGWSFHPDYHGRGYATEAAQVLLTYAFGHRNLHRVTANCDAHNAASVRLMERLGMRREGHFLQSECRNGVWHDTYLYALLQNEWALR
jgi:RimJ/RimL family protein N-acetyltransferase